jgi:hypothetical protein
MLGHGVFSLRPCADGTGLDADILRPLKKARPAHSSDIHSPPLDQGGRAEVSARQFKGTWRQGQLPNGQTAKARPDYRVQSLHKGHGRIGSIESKHDIDDTLGECLSSCRQL